MKTIIAMTIGAGIVYVGTVAALFSVGVVASAVTKTVLEEILD